jgi:hypothetical protein
MKVVQENGNEIVPNCMLEALTAAQNATPACEPDDGVEDGILTEAHVCASLTSGPPWASPQGPKTPQMTASDPARRSSSTPIFEGFVAQKKTCLRNDSLPGNRFDV